MKKGLKVFGNDGVAAVKKKMLQLHDRKVMAPKHVAELTPEQKTRGSSLSNVLEKKTMRKN
jgi:hypothetical protein